MASGDEALSLETVIMVACVCGSIVLVLTVVLIVLCCRRRRTKCQCNLQYTRQTLIAQFATLKFVTIRFKIR